MRDTTRGIIPPADRDDGETARRAELAHAAIDAAARVPKDADGVPLPYVCFICGRRMRPEFPEGYDPREDCRQPSGGIEFQGWPAYGSEFDDDRPNIIICDTCFRQHMDRASVKVVQGRRGALYGPFTE